MRGVRGYGQHLHTPSGQQQGCSTPATCLHTLQRHRLLVHASCMHLTLAYNTSAHPAPQPSCSTPSCTQSNSATVLGFCRPAPQPSPHQRALAHNPHPCQRQPYYRYYSSHHLTRATSHSSSLPHAKHLPPCPSRPCRSRALQAPRRLQRLQRRLAEQALAHRPPVVRLGHGAQELAGDVHLGWGWRGGKVPVLVKRKVDRRASARWRCWRICDEWKSRGQGCQGGTGLAPASRMKESANDVTVLHSIAHNAPSCAGHAVARGHGGLGSRCTCCGRVGRGAAAGLSWLYIGRAGNLRAYHAPARGTTASHLPQPLSRLRPRPPSCRC